MMVRLITIVAEYFLDASNAAVFDNDCHIVCGTMYLPQRTCHNTLTMFFLSQYTCCICHNVFADLCVRVIADSERSRDGRSKVAVMGEFKSRMISKSLLTNCHFDLS